MEFFLCVNLVDYEKAFYSMAGELETPVGAYESLCDSWEICHPSSQHLWGHDMLSHTCWQDLRWLWGSYWSQQSQAGMSPITFPVPAGYWLVYWGRLQQTRETEYSGHCWHADDLALLSHNLRQLQEKTSDLDNSSAQLGLNIHRHPAHSAPRASRLLRSLSFACQYK